MAKSDKNANSISFDNSSAVAERPHEFTDFNGVGHFEAKFYVEGLRFAPISVDC